MLFYAFEKNIPVFGICRGAQLINVFFNGTLYKDTIGFYEEYPRIRTILPRKKVLIEKGSIISFILKKKEIRVNALHHQSVKKCGDKINISAYEPNSIIQGIEYSGDNFIYGVQWHPEYLLYKKSQRALFKALIKKAKR